MPDMLRATLGRAAGGPDDMRCCRVSPRRSCRSLRAKTLYDAVQPILLAPADWSEVRTHVEEERRLLFGQHGRVAQRPAGRGGVIGICRPRATSASVGVISCLASVGTERVRSVERA